MVRYAVLMARSRIVNLANFQQFTAINVLTDPGHVGGEQLIPGCIQVVLIWSLEDGKLAHNVLHASAAVAFAPTTPIANTLLTGLTTGPAWTAFAAHLASTTVLAGVSLLDRRTANAPIVGSGATGAAGTGVGEALPNEVSLCVTFRTALSGRGQRGRMYVPGFGVGSLSPGNVASAATVADTQAWAQTIPGVFSASGLTLALAQPARNAYTGSTGTQHPARGAGVLPITAELVRDNHWDSQRRRGLK
jgi:hypothetical protein